MGCYYYGKCFFQTSFTLDDLIPHMVSHFILFPSTSWHPFAHVAEISSPCSPRKTTPWCSHSHIRKKWSVGRDLLSLNNPDNQVSYLCNSSPFYDWKGYLAFDVSCYLICLTRTNFSQRQLLGNICHSWYLMCIFPPPLTFRINEILQKSSFPLFELCDFFTGLHIDSNCHKIPLETLLPCVLFLRNWRENHHCI